VTSLAIAPAQVPVRAVAHADAALIAFNAVIVAAGIAANLGFEEVGLDLYVGLVGAGAAQLV
jgi:hypothetical protein